MSRQLESYRGGPCPPPHLDAIPLSKCARNCTLPTRFPRERRRRIRTDSAIERLNREARRRTRVVGTFPDGKSALMLVTARLEYVAESEWGSRRYLDVMLLDE